MFKRHKIFNLIYVVILLFNVYALAVGNELLRMIAMPLIGMSLILYLLIKTRIEHLFHKLIFIGLVLSMGGDIQLLFTDEPEFYFFTALVLTLASYGLYGAAYFLDFRKDFAKTKRVGNILLLVMAIAIVGSFFMSRNTLGDFIYPAIAYFLMLSLMVVLSGYRYQRVNRLSFKLILTGSFAFSISDLSIGYYHFVDSEKVMMISYLLTYLIAQYLVVIGSIERRVI